MEIAIVNACALAERVGNAGVIFVGRFVLEVLGDYMVGFNHVLSTARSARFSSGLGVMDFLKRTLMIECDSGGLVMFGLVIIILVWVEGLDVYVLLVVL